MIRLERSFTPLSFKQPKLEKKKEEETKTEEKKPEANTSEQTGTKSGNSNKTLADFLNNNNMLPISYKPINLGTPVVIATPEDNEKDFYDKGHKNYELKEHTNNDAKTFLINPTNLVDYDNDQRDTSPRPGIPGPWASSLRWIGR